MSPHEDTSAFDEDTPVVILCGGRGTRLQEHTVSIPKPLVEIGGLPILWHVVRIYAAQGRRRFVLCLGYKGELIERFVERHPWPEGTRITCVDTGLDTPTGGRVQRVSDHVGNRPFHLTYADGVADVAVAELEAHHRRQATLATVTVVRPRLQFGVADLAEDGRIRGFEEKPRSEHWINGGFFCLEPRVFEYLEDSSVLEREPLERLASEGELGAFRHEGFWDCMDTYKDAVLLNDLWQEGRAPWRLWD